MDATRHGQPARAGAAALVGLAAALLAGCGGSTPADSGSGEGPEQIGTATGEYGTYLTADDGKAVYLWEGDHSGTSACSGACAGAWPPVLTDGAPHAGSGVATGQLGTVKRSDGTTQVTYAGHPLYYYAGDGSAGSTNGEGSKGFGAAWWLVAPGGTAVMEKDESPSPTDSSSSDDGGY
ncbi:COG4315 family predicted lipoprotein [Nocardioides jejuensis]|uniref:COG4315 family predicted lipoprotein n=1 Tax=Nocardioides jejuensis TaxID=2502782 RepID=UPI001A9D4D1E|nr:hypothetical protein [Nocardioides jejuensis]